MARNREAARQREREQMLPHRLARGRGLILTSAEWETDLARAAQRLREAEAAVAQAVAGLAAARKRERP